MTVECPEAFAIPIAESVGQRGLFEQIVRAAGNPLVCVFTPDSAGHNAVHVKMFADELIPCVQHGDKADRTLKAPLRVGGKAL